jgi:orotidine-5'-phosphate decarboxylase
MSTLESARDRLIFALDVGTRDEGLRIADSLAGELRWIKVATTLFTSAGAEFIEELRERGFDIFLDLKFHDIPAQVEGACESAAALGAKLMTVHASGGHAMLEAAARGAARGSETFGGDPTKVLAVTVLTSLDQSDLATMGVQRALNEQVLALAKLTEAAGCHGIVSSPQELPLLRPALAPPFGILTPGIRPKGAALGDQKRVTTPGDAIRGGSDWLVVGRPIRNADDRAAATRAILNEMAEALGD